MAAEQQRPVITKELLRELGDWRAEKEGRALAAAGNVVEWDYQAPFLSGTVRTGGATINARIKLGARAIDVENLCVCRQARDKGRICPHVMALVYATILPAKPAGEQAPAISARPKAREPGLKYVALEDAGDENQSLELMVLLPLDLP